MNTRFAVAVHILTLIESQANQPTSSEWIAGSVNTNPALIRRLLSQLARAGLTRSRKGAGGGALLARSAHSITLAEVYRAISDDTGMLPIHPAPNPRCPIGRNIQRVLADRIHAAEEALHAELGRTTIADLATDLASSSAP